MAKLKTIFLSRVVNADRDFRSSPKGATRRG